MPRLALPSKRPPIGFNDRRCGDSCTLPRTCQSGCHSPALAGFGLLFGAFDFGVRADGSLDFYECNSAGQWHWLEMETGLPMTSALADLLEATT